MHAVLEEIFLNIFARKKPLTVGQGGSGFLRSTCDLYGFENVAYIGLNLPARASKAGYVHSTSSKSWTHRHETEDYVSTDPLNQLGLGRISPIDWSDTGELSPAQRKFFSEARESVTGRRGLTFPLHGMHGETAVFGVTANLSAREWCNFKNTHLRRLRIIANYFHQLVLGDVMGAEAAKSQQLTERELECLRCSAQGKTYEEIGALLGISSRTVKFFLENAREKLGCLNTTHSVASAILRGLI